MAVEHDLNTIAFWKQFVSEIDWSEPFLVAVLSFHVMCLALTLLTHGHAALQMALLTVLVGLVLSAEKLNELAALHWESFSREQYFDSTGMFITIVLSLPALFNAIVLVGSMMWSASSMLITVKRRQLQDQARQRSNVESSAGTSDPNVKKDQ